MPCYKIQPAKTLEKVLMKSVSLVNSEKCYNQMSSVFLVAKMSNGGHPCLPQFCHLSPRFSALWGQIVHKFSYCKHHLCQNPPTTQPLSRFPLFSCCVEDFPLPITTPDATVQCTGRFSSAERLSNQLFFSYVILQATCWCSGCARRSTVNIICTTCWRGKIWRWWLFSSVRTSSRPGC